jgi:RNA methyltransferase, TrmH family
VFLVEGRRQLECALASGARVLDVYAAPSLYLGDEDKALVERAACLGARVIVVGREAFRSISGNLRPDGIAAVVARPPTGLDQLLAPSLLLVAVGTERPGNLGAIVRTAEATGAGVLLCDAATDAFHPEAVRGSVGTVFTVPLAQAATAQALAWLRRHEARIVVATPGASRPVWSGEFRGPRVAVVVGGERYGLGRSWADAADETVGIPMAGRADSLNVAVAAGIVLFEAARQRAG